jgi:hypothetical protein
VRRHVSKDSEGDGWLFEGVGGCDVLVRAKCVHHMGGIAHNWWPLITRLFSSSLSPVVTFHGLLVNVGCCFSVCLFPYDSRVES